MTLNQIHYFTVLAKTENMRQAAQILYLSQPSLTAMIRKLEQELGCNLFDRTGRRLRLTAEGKAFLTHCETIEAEIAHTKSHMEALAAKRKTVVSIGCIEPLLREYLPEKMRLFQEKQENTDIEFIIQDGTTPEMVVDLKNGKLDFILGSEMEDEMLQQSQLMENPLVMICSREDPQQEYKPLGKAMVYHQPCCTWEALARMPLLGYTQSSAMDPVLEAMWLSQGISLNYRYRMPNETAIISLVANGFGSAVIPWVSDLENFPVAVYPLPEGAYHQRLCILSLREHKLQGAAKSFVEFLLRKQNCPGI